MNQYKHVGTLGEVKAIQLTQENIFVGIDKNGFAYIFTNGETKKITKDDVASILSLNERQVTLLLKKRGKIELSDLFKDGNHAVMNAHDTKPVVQRETDEQSVNTEVKVAIEIAGKEGNADIQVGTGSLLVEEHMDIPVGREKVEVDEIKDETDETEFVDFEFEKTNDSTITIPTVCGLPSLNKSENKSLKTRVATLERQIKWFKENTVTKEQLIKVIETLEKGK